jgi:uncharacterized protein YjbI with pentapeptide repeats
MEETRVEGNNLVKNGVYNIYYKDGNVNVGVCLVESNNKIKIKLKKISDLSHVVLTFNKSEIYGKNPVNLRNSKLRDSILIHADLRKADLHKADLRHAHLRHADLSYANLSNADLRFAHLRNSNLRNADLRNADLRNAHLDNADLHNADLTGATILKNVLSYRQIKNIIREPNYSEHGSNNNNNYANIRRQYAIDYGNSNDNNYLNNHSSNTSNNNNSSNTSNSNNSSNTSSNNNSRSSGSNNNRYNINRTFDGNDLVKTCVYNIYQKDGNVNVGVCLVEPENNRNNGTRIKLRKLIGNTELSLVKSEIYGKIPVNLRNANLTDAVLTGAVLIGADLTDANLIGAVLIGAVLIGANLTDAYLTGADLTGACLIDSDLTNAILTYADLTDADLTNADLTGANLNNAIIFRDSLSEEQIQQIIGEPNYIQRPRGINPNVGPPIRRILSYNSNNENNQRPQVPQQQEIRIVISEKLLNPVKNSNNSCPNFDELYKFIMRQNLSGRFFFKYEGSNHKVFDYGGARRDVFDKILPVYTKKFFKEIEDNEDYVIIRENVDMDTLYRETNQLILLAYASETMIFLKIDPTLLSLLVETHDFKTYFTNNKRNRFTKLYAEFNEYIQRSNNNDYLLKHTNNKRELMKKLKNPEFKSEELKKEIKQEIRFRRFAIKCGFTNIQQFINMSDFIDDFYNISPKDRFITCELKFDIETILKRIKLFKKIYVNPVDYYLEPIPLEQYVRFSQNNESVSIINNSNAIITTYPYLIPFLNFIFGPESLDDDRKLFVVYVSGSSSYTGELKIYLSSLTHVKAGRPYNATTCEKYLEIFINREQNRHSITVDAIRTLLLTDAGFGLE